MPLPAGTPVPAPIVVQTSCGGFRLAPGGAVSRLPHHWFASHSGGTGRTYEPKLDVRRDARGGITLLRAGRMVWRSAARYPRDAGDVAFGPGEFAFASYRRGIYLTDLKHPERLVLRGRSLWPLGFAANGDLVVASGRRITVVSRAGRVLRTYAYRRRNGYAFDDRSGMLFFVTPGDQLAAGAPTAVTLRRSLRGVDGELFGQASLTPGNLLLFVGSRDFTVTRPDGTVVAHTAWLESAGHLDSGVAVSADGSAFAYRLSDARPGAKSGTAVVYLLRAGAAQPSVLYRDQLGPIGCGVGANLSWHGQFLLYGRTGNTLAVINTTTSQVKVLTRLIRRLPPCVGSGSFANWQERVEHPAR